MAGPNLAQQMRDEIIRKIDALYAYTNVPRSTTKACLETIRDDVEGRLDTLGDVDADDD